MDLGSDSYTDKEKGREERMARDGVQISKGLGRKILRRE